ncbi:hypothetical protein BD769DRAFT_1396429 [Suillus cothurnatus]|nr:hypothetical protein BD769DRAFT_1396429 [Suillus cothurnatus]
MDNQLEGNNTLEKRQEACVDKSNITTLLAGKQLYQTHCPCNQQIMSYDVVDDNNNNNNGPCTEEGELNTWAVLKALKTQVIHQSIFHAHELNNSDNEYMQIPYPCSPALSAGSIPDDEYRPSPLSEAAVGLPSPEQQAYPSTELTEDEIAVHTMAKPVVWLSAWQYTRTLGLNTWIDTSVANYYLLQAERIHMTGMNGKNQNIRGISQPFIIGMQEKSLISL